MLSHTPLPNAPTTVWRLLALPGLALALSFAPGRPAQAEEAQAAQAAPVAQPHPVPPASEPNSVAQDMGRRVREALQSGQLGKKQLNLVIESPPQATPAAPSPVRAQSRSLYQRGHAKAHGRKPKPAAPKHTPARPPVGQRDIHWSYAGEGGPQVWGRLKPEYAICASGRRQSPIHIEDGQTLQGPAEAIEFHYTPSRGTVVNNGHSIQVNVLGGNSLTVRGMSYQLVQFHFHTPSEERINHQSYPLVGHFVHRNDLGQLAVLAVLFSRGEANALIDKVWTHMPLDVNDSVRMPAGLIDITEVLPNDQRYYQYLGSLTTPPCTEGVLWLILKQPMSVSPAQLRLFSQLYPHNARPLQAVNGRPVRNAVSLPTNSAAAPATQ
ncbi:MAG: carbonic anhydrase family protein [Hylemonella sp.]|nr:carbonic anhydrase family protein [Hylemonella sp.]